MYLLVTRVRDEENYLPELFRSVLRQTVRPNLWVIVDHDSKDGSAAIMAKAVLYEQAPLSYWPFFY